MDMRGYEVPRVLVICRSRQIDEENVPLNYYINNDLSIQFGIAEFCLVTGLRFGVENRQEYDTQANLPFRQRVFPSHLDGQHIMGIDIANAIVGPTFAELYNDDAVGLCCLGILQLVLLGAESRCNVPEWELKMFRRWGHLVMSINLQMKMIRQHIQSLDILGHSRVAAWNKKKGRFLAEMIIPFFERDDTNDNEARSDWWISSKAYFDGFIDQVERVPFDLSRKNMYEIPFDIYRQFVEQKIKLEGNKKDVDDIKEEMLKFREEMNARPVRQENTVSSHMGRPNLQTTIETQHDVDGIVDRTWTLQRYEEEIMKTLSYGTPIGWLGGEHMNSWMELMIRRRPLNANWTVAYTSTISVHPENNQLYIQKALTS
ncbi:hypothetical protein Tco_0749974 [Tanacetum coccineum]|uniref:Uncharacterized protein n=1 Tax=Tanacetum coccineum TaxID=301880 RepID=A0ABQ4Z348_9ASTR